VPGSSETAGGFEATLNVLYLFFPVLDCKGDTCQTGKPQAAGSTAIGGIERVGGIGGTGGTGGTGACGEGATVEREQKRGMCPGLYEQRGGDPMQW
jgi:hypothetical protein